MPATNTHIEPDRDDKSADSEVAPMQGAQLWATGALLALANFLVVLDITIVNVSVPNVAGGLAVASDQGTWVITSYAVAEAIMIPLSSWLSQRFGAVKLFALGVVGFGLCSALCGFAPSLSTLVLFRVLQGLCGGPIVPLSQTLLRRIFPKSKQSAALGLWAMTTVIAPIAGPLLGGILVDNVGWRWIFFINVPVAIIVSFSIWRLMASRETKSEHKPVDIVGLALLVTWVGALQIMLDKGKDDDWFNSPFIVALALIAVLGFVAFVIWVLTSKDPIVDLRVYRHRGFVSATIVMALAYGSFFSSIVLLPLWLQTNLGYTATWAGRATAFQGMLALIMSPIVAKLTTTKDSRVLVSIGMAILAAISFWRSTFSTDITFWQIAAPAIVQGFALPFFFIPLNGVALNAVLPRETISAASLFSFTRSVSASFATSITTTEWANITTGHRVNLSGSLNGGRELLDMLTNSGSSSVQSLMELDSLVQTQAVMLATNTVFFATVVLFISAALAVWIAPKSEPMGNPADASH